MSVPMRHGGNPFLNIVKGGLLVVVATLGLYLYSGHSFDPHKTVDTNASLLASPGAAGD